MKQEITAVAVKTSPPIAVIMWERLASVPLEKWVQVATLIYILLQAYFLVRNQARKNRRKGDR